MPRRLLLIPLLLAAPLALASDQVRTGGSPTVVRAGERMRRIPAGPFIFGMDDIERVDALQACHDELGPDVATYHCDQQPRLMDAATGTPREVWISAFDIDTYEVTTRDYRGCVAAGACDPMPLVKGDTRLIVDAWPVVNVTWYDATAYCRWRGKRLPSEAEWEKAARGTDGRRFPWGPQDGVSRANRGAVQEEALRAPVISAMPAGVPDATDGHKLLAPPGSYPFGKSPYGVHDMAGNVSEWVDDWYVQDAYRGATTFDPRVQVSATGLSRVSRGGSFLDMRLVSRVYYRDAASPGFRSIDRGFRCARSVGNP